MSNYAMVVFGLSAMAALLLGCESRPPESAKPVSENRKGEAVLRASTAIRQICEIAAKNDEYNLSKTTTEEIKHIMGDTPYSSEDLAAIVRACKAMSYPRFMEDWACDLVLEFAADYGVDLLSQRTDEAAESALQRIKQELYGDGAGALYMDEAIEEQNRLIRAKRNHTE